MDPLKVALFLHLNLVVAVVYKMTKSRTMFGGLMGGLRLFGKLVAGMVGIGLVLLVVEQFV